MNKFVTVTTTVYMWLSKMRELYVLQITQYKYMIVLNDYAPFIVVDINVRRGDVGGSPPTWRPPSHGYNTTVL